MKRKVCFVTGGRSDFGLLSILKSAMEQDYETRMMDSVFSGDGPAAYKFDMSAFTVRADLDANKPDLLILLGDRYEILAAACIAHLMKIPIAHIHGGELTEGSLDDSMRHAITKLAGIHFTATEKCRQRVIQMGEQLERVFNVGALGLDGIENVKAKGSGHFLVTYHPETLGHGDVGEVIAALSAFPNEVIWCSANADDGGREINAKIPAQTFMRDEYLSLMKGAAVVIGNSSSGIIEAPSLGVPTVNIGDRQKRRERGWSVQDCPCYCDAIKRAIAGALTIKPCAVINPYGSGGSASRIKAILDKTDFPSLIYKTWEDA